MSSRAADPALFDLPPLYYSMNAQSIAAQRLYLGATRLRLMLALVATASGLGAVTLGDSPIDLAAVLAAMALLLAVFVELFLQSEQPERKWYEGRAVAESIKTVVWRYSVCSAPFPASLAIEPADELLLTRLTALLHDLRVIHVDMSSLAVPSPEMRALRVSDLGIRRSIYREHRIHKQQTWYASRSASNTNLARRWRACILVAEFFGILAATGKAFDLFSIDMAGFMGAVVAAIVGWVAVKQYRSLAQAYSVAAVDLAALDGRLSHVTDEGAWSLEVADAEKAISREHVSWRASRLVLSA